MEYEDPTYLQDALWDLEFWDYWIQNKPDTVAAVKDNFAQLLDQGTNGNTNFMNFYNEQMAALERAYILKDLYGFDYIKVLLEDKIPDVYREFWSNKNGATQAKKDEFEDLRRYYGIPWAKDFARYYMQNTDFAFISNQLADWKFMKDNEATISKYARAVATKNMN